MNSTVVVALVVAVVASVVDWTAVARQIKPLEFGAKPLATVAFLVAAMAIDADDATAQVVRVVALVFCLLGDVFLMLPRNAFVPGLASFAVAQVLLAVSFAAQDPKAIGLVVGVLVAVPVAALLARRFIGALRRNDHHELVIPVVVYMLVISAMVMAGMSGGTAVGIAGGILFLVSDSLIAEHRFVKARPWKSVAIMVTYHGALAGLVLGLV